MITGALFSLIAVVIDVLVMPLPVASLGVTASASSFVTNGSGVLTFLNAFIPVAEMMTALGFVVTVFLPAMIVYQTVMWLYRHIPFLGG